MRVTSYSATFVLAIALLATLFGVRGALSRQSEPGKQGDSVTTVGGVLTITPPKDFKCTIRLGGKPIHTFTDARYVNIYSFNSRYEMGDTVLISVANGGNGCPAMFYVVHIKSATKYYVTEEFGDCSDIPTVSAGLDRLEVKFPGFYQLWQKSEPGFKQPLPTTYVYRDNGKVTELRPAKKK